MSGYQTAIKEIAPEFDPRHIEGYMRLQYGTLDHLDPVTFRREALIGVACIQEGGVPAAEELAQSYGL